MPLKFTVRVVDLQTALARMGSTSPTVPHPNRHCLIRADAGAIKLTIDDVSSSVTTTVSATDVEAGDACLFTESLAALPACAGGDSLIFDVNDNWGATVQSFQRSFSVSGINPQQHPAYGRKIDPAVAVSVDADALLSALQATVFVARGNRQGETSALVVRVNGDTLSVSVANSFCLAKACRVIDCDDVTDAWQTVLPFRLASEIVRVLRQSVRRPRDRVVLQTNDRTVVAAIGSTTISCLSLSDPRIRDVATALSGCMDFVCKVELEQEKALDAVRSIVRFRGPEHSSSVILHCSAKGAELISDRTQKPSARSPIDGAVCDGECFVELDSSHLEAAMLAQESGGVVIRYVKNDAVEAVIVDGGREQTRWLICVRV